MAAGSISSKSEDPKFGVMKNNQINRCLRKLKSRATLVFSKPFCHQLLCHQLHYHSVILYSGVIHTGVIEEGISPVPEKKMGKRRICPACGVKYYDMNREPVTCPRCEAPYRKEGGTRRQKAVISEKIPETDIEPEITALTESTLTDEENGDNKDTEAIPLPDTDDDHDDLLPEETESSDLSSMAHTIPTKKTTDE